MKVISNSVGLTGVQLLSVEVTHRITLDNIASCDKMLQTQFQHYVLIRHVREFVKDTLCSTLSGGWS